MSSEHGEIDALHIHTYFGHLRKVVYCLHFATNKAKIIKTISSSCMCQTNIVLLERSQRNTFDLYTL